MKKLFTLVAAALAANLVAATHTYEATYTAKISDLPTDAKNVRVWIPLPKSRPGQVISDVRIDSPYKWKHATEKEFGNEYLYTTLKNPPAELTVLVHFRAQRDDVAITALPDRKATPRELKRELQSDRLVTISPRIRSIAGELVSGKTETIDKARAIYDYVVANMNYDKTRPGWGNGDTERACDIKAGNCTDFHSLFISLARASNIPARFVIGFPLTAADGQVKGYHCWAEFWDASRGWIPVDASEAQKAHDSTTTNFLFGNQKADRIEFTRGRDLVLSPCPNEKLNYFIYPHAEIKDADVGNPSIALSFKELSANIGR